MEQRIDLAPNCSLQPAAARLFFAVTCLFSLSFSLVFVCHGFWPVLPFWALEMAALGLALRASLKRRHYTQTVLISDSQIKLVTRSRQGAAEQEFARHWAKVKLRTPLKRSGTSRLTIESHGRSYEVGNFLTEENRRQLAQRLRSLVGGMNESPPLEVVNLGDPFRT